MNNERIVSALRILSTDAINKAKVDILGFA